LAPNPDQTVSEDRIMKAGTFVRHRARPDWGLGHVLLVSSHYSIEFESHGLVKLAPALANAHLEVVDEATVPAGHPLRAGKKPRGTKRVAAKSKSAKDAALK
jgi:Protein of unknown function (DUF3553)